MDTWNLGRPLNRRPSYYDQICALPADQVAAREAVGRDRRPRKPSRQRTRNQAAAIDRLVAALARLTSEKPRRQDLVNLDRRMQRFDLHQSHRDLATALHALANPPIERLQALGRFLATTARHRTTVGLGVVLLGVFGNDDDQELLIALGTLSGLCCYASNALATSHSQEALFELARRADGWPRVDAVRLLGAPVGPAVQKWLIAEACTGDILDAYFALEAAQAGDLAGHLAPETVDDALLQGASRLLRAMTDPSGPRPNVINYYDQAPAAVTAFVRHVRRRHHTLANLLHLQWLGQYLQTEAAEAIAWAAGELAVTRGSIEQYITDDRAVRAVHHGLDHPSLPTFRQAIWAAPTMRIPVAERVLARLEEHPTDMWLWYTLLDNCPEADIGDIVNTAARLLLSEPPTTHETAESTSTCAVESALDMIVSRLDNHPGRGWRLIEAALHGRAVRTRNMAVKALAAWPAEMRTRSVSDALRAACDVESDPDTKARMGQILEQAGSSVDQTHGKRS